MCVWLQPEGEDDLKKIQLMELAIMNGTYRDQTKLLQAAAQSARKFGARVANTQLSNTASHKNVAKFRQSCRFYR